MSQTKYDGAVRQRETEPLGITYDRLRLDALLTRLVKERGIKTARSFLPTGRRRCRAFTAWRLRGPGCM